MFKAFFRSKKPWWSVEIAGGPCTVRGTLCAGFITVRYLRSLSRDDACEVAVLALRREFKKNGVEVHGEIKVKSSARLAADEKAPKRESVNFWEREHSSHTFFEDLTAKFGTEVEVLPTGRRFKKRSEDGFDVEVLREDIEFTVFAKSWHGHYDDKVQTSACLRWLFTPYYRVAEEHRDGQWIGSWIERWGAQGWEPMEPVVAVDAAHLIDEGHGDFIVTYSQQAELDPGDYTKFVPGAVLDADGFPPGSFIGVHAEVKTQCELEQLGIASLIFELQRKGDD